MSEVLRRGNEILAGNVTSVDEIKRLTRDLKGEWHFGIARRLLANASAMKPDDREIRQQLALCTYKDEELQPRERFANAIGILEGIGLRNPANKDSETLALGGAVCKRKWEYGGQVEDLHESLAFYRAAHKRDPDTDKGYGGENAAYVLQLLASRARAAAHRTGTEAEAIEAERLDAEARELRERMVGDLRRRAERDPTLKEQYWFVVTVAEIEFGLRHYEEARRQLDRARTLEATEWERQTTFRQLVSIARMNRCPLPEEGSEQASWHPAWRALAGMLGADTERALSCYRGKVGLALSGGGFRASFFHLGVMARLAETDVLRGVDVISTVSGGSIVGAHYYLEVRQWLRSRQDQDITRQDYVDIVRRVQAKFLAGVQRNIRTRALASFRDNLRMIFSKSYTRSHKMGELYETELYSRVNDGHRSGVPRRMKDLVIEPAGYREGPGFKPKFSNWRRRAKVPVLLVNTTSLNSGHLWHFTATWMGEPPGLLGGEVDTNQRYRRLYYDEAPTDVLKKYRLGHAVAASACVPGLFEPLVIDELYEDRVVRLVDGGVHDNQGVEGLLDEGCTFILCSDASGQMKDLRAPSGGVLSVLLRSSQSILMDRVREAECQDLHGRAESRALDGLFFVHLKKDLSAPPLAWKDCKDPAPEVRSPNTTTSYGIDADVQRQLADIRTDLDSFTEVEAYALMLSGYLMTEQELDELQKHHKKLGEQGTWGGFDIGAERGHWPFLPLEPILSQPKTSADPRRKDVGLQLDVGASLFFKVLRLYPALRWASWIGGGMATALMLWMTWAYRNATFTIGSVVAIAALTVAGLFVPAMQWLFPERAMRNVVGKAAAAFFGYLAARLHLAVFEPLYLRRGRLQRLLGLRQR